MRDTPTLPIILSSILLLLPLPAIAQNTHDNSGPAVGESKTGESQLDELFASLALETDTRGARSIARKIWQVWTESGSDTVDLLMQWTSEAIRKEEYALAGDLLTQVTTLRPDYVEGWNRSATLHYLMSDYGRSLSDIERTLQLEPRHFGALAGLASILQRTEEDGRALETWYNVLKIYPANENAQNAVIELEEKLAGDGI